MESFTIPPNHLLPIGFRFRPTEEELITHYLKNKILGHQSLVQYIPQIDLFNYDPWDLPKQSLLESDNYEWFFFRSHISKTKRITSAGCWRSTGDDKRIMARGTDKVIATRKILVFYLGRGSNAVKTNWVIHEYHLQQDADFSSSQMPFVVCRLKENAEELKSDVSNQQKKSKKRQIQELNGDNNQLALEDFVNTQQPTQPPKYFENEGYLTEFTKSMFVPDECLDDASSKMSKTTPWCSESEPREQLLMNNIQYCSDNNGEVNYQLLQPESSKTRELNSYELNLLLNEMLDNDETFDEVTSNNLTDSCSKEDLESMVRELQAGDTTFDFSVICEGTRSIIQKSRRKPLIAKHSQYKEEKDELQDNSRGQTLKVQRQPKSNNIVAYGDEPKRNQLTMQIRSKTMPQHKAEEDDQKHISVTYSIESPTNCFWYILTTKRIHHKSSDQPIDYVAKVFLGFIMLIMFVLTNF